MTDLTARLSSHDDPRLYREADELMQEAAVEIIYLRADLANARAAALEEAAGICETVKCQNIMGTYEQYIAGKEMAVIQCAYAIRAAITKGAKP